jgi:pSer/pThr/pTyr-binding forkhead associated (FHA) protein
VALPAPSGRPLPELSLAIISGSAAEPSYTLAVPHLAIGRGAEVRDSHNRLLRTNHIVFSDGDDDAVAQTVSRRHAHIEYEAAAGEYRIVDDLSAHGTSLVRSGRTIPVPAGTRGIRLRNGDEIVLGEARIRVAVDAG